MLKSKRHIANFHDIMDKFENVSASKRNVHKSFGLVVHENM